MIINISGSEVLIDDEDEELVSRYKWHIGSTGYAVWRGVEGSKKKTVRMHRLIANCPDEMVVDHINHNKLDNRRSNLRICTQSDNMRNKTNQGKGYWYQKQNSNWVVEVYGKHIGCFDTEEEAANIANLIRSGGTYTKPVRTHCKYGHELKNNSYIYGKTVLCKICHKKRSERYYARKQNRRSEGGHKEPS